VLVVILPKDIMNSGIMPDVLVLNVMMFNVFLPSINMLCAEGSNAECTYPE
jgi:hypothetical protein